MGVVEKKKTVFDNNATIKANAERANNTIKTLNNTVDELETTITEKNAEIKMYQYDITDKSVKLNNTKIAMNELGVEDATTDNTAEKVPDVYNKGVESQQETINLLNENIEYQDSIIQEKETAIQQKDKENAEQFEMLKDTYTAISNYGIDDVTPYNTAEKVPEVYGKGKTDEYNAFWDSFQDNGNRTQYSHAFSGQVWTKDIFKPKYDIKPINANYMFASWNSISEDNLDIAKTLEECGVVLDTSQCTSFTYFLMYGATQHLPVIDTRSANTLNNFSSNSSIRTIDKIILKDDGSQIVNTMFAFIHSSLRNIVFEGVIGQNFNLSTCPYLTAETIASVMSCLKDYSGTTTTRTLTLHANGKALLTETDIATITQKGWTLA